MNSSDIISIILVGILIILFIWIFIRISRRIRKGGGSLPFLIMTGATDAFLDRDKKEAVKMIVEQNAHKKMEDQSSADPPEKSASCQ